VAEVKIIVFQYSQTRENSWHPLAAREMDQDNSESINLTGL
jgi:hypothetical protein